MNYYTIPGIKRPGTIGEDHIINAVCFVCNTTFEALKKRNRKRELVMARQFIYYFLRKRTALSLKSIGEIFGQDHTTVIHSVDTITNLLCTEDPAVMEGLRLIKAQIN